MVVLQRTSTLEGWRYRTQYRFETDDSGRVWYSRRVLWQTSLVPKGTPGWDKGPWRRYRPLVSIMTVVGFLVRGFHPVVVRNLS
jgi:hypothetical protein